ncbi:MAG: hypothetical protein EB127_04585 [Alphaproteobacteria bacterium]|nr:hypothetical protein [Alphaproteobacteria bacterium]
MIDSNIYSCFQEELIEYYPNIEATNQALSQAINQSPLNQLFNKEKKICLISSLYAAQIVAKLIKNFAGHNFSFYVVGRKSAEILESSGVKVLCYSEDIESLINKIAINAVRISRFNVRKVANLSTTKPLTKTGR